MSDEDSIDLLCNRVDKMACGHCGKHLDVSDQAPFTIITCPHCDTKQSVPAQLGQFLLVEQLGAGGMGAVYRAVDSALGRFVAIKVMKKALGDDEALVESFLREARAAAALNHPNIVQIYSCGQEKGQPYIVMELVGGGRLDLMMADGKKVDEVRLLEVALDVSEGLKAANGVGLVHGDIKPANILFDKSGTAKVVDFGLAQFVNRQQEQGGVWGTPYYISPERARGAKADHRSDIYSLGATMFHALTARAPFEGKTAADVVVARLKAPPPKLSEVEPGLQPKTSDLIERMMAADPVLRYPTSASLQADMKHALGAAREARSASGRARRQPKRTSSHVIIGIVMALVLLGLVVAVVRWFGQAQREREAELAAQAAAAAAQAATQVQPPATNAVVEGETATVQQMEGGQPKTSVLFFEGDAEKAIVEAAATLTGPRALDMFDRLEGFSTNVPRNSARFMWIRVLQAIPLGLAGESARADKLVREVASASISQRAGHPVFMPQVMAQYLIGDLSEDRFAKARADWPAWYGDLGSFYRGLQALNRGDVEEGAAALEGYARSRREGPAWAYAMKPAAEHWLRLLGAWDAERRKVQEMVIADNLEGARAALDAHAAQAPAFLKASVASVRGLILEGEARRADVARQAQERERRQVVQAELDRLDEVMGTNAALIVAKDFRKVQQVLARLAPVIETPEGREQVKILREQVDRMEALKTLLTRELDSDPFRQEDRELGGEAIGANVLGVRVSLAGRGTITRPWEQISPRLMVRMVSYYAGQTSRDARTRADTYLSLAVYCAMNGGFEAAANFAKQAVELDPDSATAARRLLPDVLPGS
jgi:hypothetical protein